MKQRLSKLVSIIMLLALLITTISFTTSAADSETQTQSIKVTDEIVEQIALEWAAAMEPNLEFSIANCVKVYDNDDRLTGYSIGYLAEGIPYGYVVLDFYSEVIINDFLISEGAENIYYKIADNIETISTFSVAEPKMYKTSAFDYYIPSEVNGEVIYADGIDNTLTETEFNILQDNSKARTLENKAEFYNIDVDELQKTVPEARTSKPTHWDDIFISSVPTSYTNVDSLVTLSSYKCYTESEVEMLTNSYGCVVSAMANVVGRHGLLKNNSLADTYTDLWSKSSTTTTHTSGGISYGSTTYSKMGAALKDYAVQQGKTNTTFTNYSSPTYNTFRTAISNKYDPIFGAGLELDTGERSGHGVSVVGTRSMKDSSGTVYQYIYVADGWYSTPRYICLTNTTFMDKYATVVNIK